jgi:hypothetical protein
VYGCHVLTSQTMIVIEEPLSVECMLGVQLSCINITDYDCYRGTSLCGVYVGCTVMCHVLTS